MFLSFHGCELFEVSFAAPHANPMASVVIWREELGGLGSSHTTPCGAAVPARPPTRSLHITSRFRARQWATGATNRGTRVVVLVLYSS